MKTLKGEITYSYDEAGRLKKKGLPNGITTEYSYNNIGKLENIRHTGEKFTEEYKYHYDIAGNKTGVEKARQGVESDNGSFGYGYDSLMRLTEVTKDGNILHKYSYDAFGNRIQKENYSESDMHPTTYQYNQNNQLICMVDEEEQTYTYDKRGNLTEVKSADNLIKAFTYNSANRMSDSFEVREGKNKRAEYQYNGLGQRVGQNIYSNDNNSKMPETYPNHPEKPKQQINYTIDLTRQYYNLLVSEDNVDKKEQNYYWDTNVVALEEEKEAIYYLHDDLGSPMQLMDEMGEIKESYGFDEFGCSIVQEIEKNKTQAKFGSSIQPFGFTGYQMDEVGGLYYAQARRYDAGAGRFVSEDKIQGIIASPFTLNRYNYCWNNPIELVDLNGEFPWILIPLLITVSASLTGCGDDSKEQNDSDEIPEPSEQEYEHEYGYVNSEGKYIYVNSPEVYNSEEYRYITNCYAYALDIKNNPITGERFYSMFDAEASRRENAFGAQPGLFSGGYNSFNASIISGTKDGNDELVELIYDDVSAMGRTFEEYDDSMSGGYVVLLVVNPGEDYHLYRQHVDGTWSHKRGSMQAKFGIKNPVEDAEKEGYTSVVGFYYIKEKCDNE